MNEEMFVTEDFDADIKAKEELIKEAEALDNSEDAAGAIKAANTLKKKWKRIHYGESMKEDQLEEQFNSILDKIYAKRKEIYKAAAEAKEQIVAAAEELKNSTEWSKATAKMNELMDQWKASASAGKETDDALWAKFSEARQAFFDARRTYYADMKEKFAAAKVKKDELIAEAEKLVDSVEWETTSDKFKSLMEEWKAAGSAGKEFEDDLWNKFNGFRQQFNSARNKHYEEQRQLHSERLAAKKELIAKAKEIAESASYTKDNTNAMKELSNEWKTIGYCGKASEDNVWKEFRGVMDEYFGGLRAHNEERHEAWKNSLNSAKAKKQDLITKQTNQLKYLEQEKTELLSERAVEEMEQKIADKKAFIAELQAEIEDIDATLAKDKK